MKVSLFALLARDAPVGVVFRRGPSKQVLLVRWDTERDLFEAGQWLKGRIYETHCDLSPSGERLIYFAANHRPPYHTWTAVSRPPYLTALALWPKGDTWGGGGLFRSETEIELHHSSNQLSLAEGFRLPRSVRVVPPSPPSPETLAAGVALHAARAGWRLQQKGAWHEQPEGARFWMSCHPPETLSKPHPRRSVPWDLRIKTVGVKERNGPFTVTELEIHDREGGRSVSFGRADWADWCRSGDLLLARGGKLFRLPMASAARFDPDVEPRQLVDLTELRFEPCAAPPEAAQWKGPRPRGRSLPAP